VLVPLTILISYMQALATFDRPPLASGGGSNMNVRRNTDSRRKDIV